MIIFLQIDWLSIIRNVFIETDIHIDYGQRIVVKELDFFFHLTLLLQNTPLETLGAYTYKYLYIYN